MRMRRLLLSGVVLGSLLGGIALALPPADGYVGNSCIGHKLYGMYNEGWGYHYVALNACC